MVINSNIKKKRGGGKCHRPWLLHGNMQSWEIKGHDNADWSTKKKKKLKEEGDENI